jgi:hypothetical protein
MGLSNTIQHTLTPIRLGGIDGHGAGQLAYPLK